MRFCRKSVPSFRKVQANTLARTRFRKAQSNTLARTRFRKAQANTLARTRFRKAQAPCGMTVAGCVDKKLKKKGRNKQFFCTFAPFIVRYNFY